MISHAATERLEFYKTGPFSADHRLKLYMAYNFSMFSLLVTSNGFSLSRLEL